MIYLIIFCYLIKSLKSIDFEFENQRFYKEHEPSIFLLFNLFKIFYKTFKSLNNNSINLLFIVSNY